MDTSTVIKKSTWTGKCQDWFSVSRWYNIVPFLFPSYLVEYDIQGKKSKTYNLKDLGIENAVLITAQWIIHTKVN